MQSFLKALIVKQNISRIGVAPLPAIARDKSGQFFILAKYAKPSVDEKITVDMPDAQPQGKVLIQRPGEPLTVLLLSELISIWDGSLIFFTSKANFMGELAKFDFTWFIPVIVKYRRLLGEILLISLTLQLIGLVTPMFFQVVMDKVLVNNALKTLDVIVIGFVAAILFEAILGGIRTLVFAQTSSKIDVELGARLFRHLLGLPLAYFQARRVGDSVARVRELENIRAFLTSNAMTLLMDIAFSFVFIGVMLWYSPTLTGVVLASIPVYVTISLVFTPIIRMRLDQKFNKNSENQSFLVETIDLALEKRIPC